MNTESIRINEKDYLVKFGFGANRVLAKKWGLKTLSEIGNKINKQLNFKENQEPTFEQFETIGELVLSGILNYTPEAKVKTDDVVDALLQDIPLLQRLVQLYIDSMPKGDESKNVEPGK